MVSNINESSRGLKTYVNIPVSVSVSVTKAVLRYLVTFNDAAAAAFLVYY